MASAMSSQDKGEACADINLPVGEKKKKKKKDVDYAL